MKQEKHEDIIEMDVFDKSGKKRYPKRSEDWDTHLRNDRFFKKNYAFLTIS